MHTLKERFLVNEKGDQVAVLLDIDDYHKLLEALEELESIRAYDAAKAMGDDAIPFGQAIDEIEGNRK
jgi:PHD/YefM family antitoxin component YafN of YafNO toxin-antitoxin module